MKTPNGLNYWMGYFRTKYLKKTSFHSKAKNKPPGHIPLKVTNVNFDLEVRIEGVIKT